MTKPLFNWGGQYALEDSINWKKRHRKSTESKILRKEYTRKLRRKLKKIKVEEME